MNYLRSIFASAVIAGSLLIFSEFSLIKSERLLDKRTQHLFDLLQSDRAQSDVLIIGSSNALCSLDPRYLDHEYTFLNASLDGAPINHLSNFYSKHIRGRVNNLKYVIVALHPTSLSSKLKRDDSVDSVFVRYSGTGSNLQPVRFFADLRVWHKRSILEAILTGFKEIKHNSIYYKESDVPRIAARNSQTFVNCYSSSLLPKQSDEPIHLEPPHPFQISALEELISKISSDRIVPLILITPYPKGRFNGKDLIPFHTLVNTLFKTGSAKPALVNVDYAASDYNLGDEIFHDSAHLNDYGSRVFSQYVKGNIDLRQR